MDFFFLFQSLFCCSFWPLLNSVLTSRTQIAPFLFRLSPVSFEVLTPPGRLFPLALTLSLSWLVCTNCSPWACSSLGPCSGRLWRACGVPLPAHVYLSFRESGDGSGLCLQVLKPHEGPVCGGYFFEVSALQWSFVGFQSWGH